jgi:hypothetical protein
VTAKLAGDSATTPPAGAISACRRNPAYGRNLGLPAQSGLRAQPRTAGAISACRRNLGLPAQSRPAGAISACRRNLGLPAQSRPAGAICNCHSNGKAQPCWFGMGTVTGRLGRVLVSETLRVMAALGFCASPFHVRSETEARKGCARPVRDNQLCTSQAN